MGSGIDVVWCSATAYTRRRFLTGTGAGLAALPLAASCSLRLARERGDAFRVLSASGGHTLEALGDTLLPGAAEAGVTYYVDQQLGSKTPLLLLKYLDFPMPHVEFYERGLESLEALAFARRGEAFGEIDPAGRDEIVREIAAETPEDWNGPPSPLFYFVVRNDALDVVYGTEEGFDRLEVPYMAHIAPPAK